MLMQFWNCTLVILIPTPPSGSTQSNSFIQIQAAQSDLGVMTVLRCACVRTKGNATLWMDPATVHQGGWETTAISVSCKKIYFIMTSEYSSYRQYILSIVQLLALSQMQHIHAFNIMVQLNPYWLFHSYWLCNRYHGFTYALVSLTCIFNTYVL